MGLENFKCKYFFIEEEWWVTMFTNVAYDTFIHVLDGLGVQIIEQFELEVGD